MQNIKYKNYQNLFVYNFNINCKKIDIHFSKYYIMNVPMTLFYNIIKINLLHVLSVQLIFLGHRLMFRIFFKYFVAKNKLNFYCILSFFLL